MCSDEEAFLFSILLSFRLGCLGFFYVEAKAFEIQSEEGIGGICFAERSRGTY
jgi:hypothetical protein